MLTNELKLVDLKDLHLTFYMSIITFDHRLAYLEYLLIVSHGQIAQVWPHRYLHY